MIKERHMVAWRIKGAKSGKKENIKNPEADKKQLNN